MNASLPFPHDPEPTAPGTVLTCRQVVQCFLQQTPARRDPGDEAERRRVLELFLDRHGAKPMALCRAADLVFFLSDNPNWKSDWTRLRIVRTVNRPFNWAEKLGLIARNPFKGVSQSSGERGRPMAQQEFQMVLRRTGACFRRVLVALRYSGMRPGELRALEWTMIDPVRGVAVLTKHKTARSRRDRAPRTIVLHPVLVRLLSWIRRRQREGETSCFLNSRGQPWTKDALDLRFRQLRQKLALPRDCKLYGCRHAFGTQAILNGVDLPTLAQLMGHTTTAMTLHYIHLAGQTDHLKAAVLKLRFGG